VNAPAPAVQSRRRYVSVVRADRARGTQRRILRAAHDLFVGRGYAATTVRDIAAAAGVSVAAVEQAFGTKRRLLKDAVDVAIAGDDEPVAMLDRPWARQAELSPVLDQLMSTLGGILADAQQRSAGLIAAAYEAAARDAEIAELVNTLERNRSGTARWLVARIAEHGPLVDGMSGAQAVDVVWTLIDPVVFLRLTGPRGWTVQRYGDWIARSLVRLLTDATPQP
jgi:AcrR family transcriptional regulator